MRGSELFGVSAQTDSGIRILSCLIYPTRSYCGYFWRATLWLSERRGSFWRYLLGFLLLVRRRSGISELFGVRLSGIRISQKLLCLTSLRLVFRISAFLIFLHLIYPEVIVVWHYFCTVQERVWTLWSLNSDYVQVLCYWLETFRYLYC